MTETESCIWRGYNDIEEQLITRKKKLSKLLLIKKKKKVTGKRRVLILLRHDYNGDKKRKKRRIEIMLQLLSWMDPLILLILLFLLNWINNWSCRGVLKFWQFNLQGDNSSRRPLAVAGVSCETKCERER